MSSDKIRYDLLLLVTVYICAVFIIVFPTVSYADSFFHPFNNNNPYENTKSDIRPFNNMARKFILLTEEVLNNAQKTTTDQTKEQKKDPEKETQKETEKTTTATPEPKPNTQAQQDNKLPITSITAPTAPNTTTTESIQTSTATAKSTTSNKPETKTTEQKPGELKLEEPKIEKEVPKVEELNLPAPKTDTKGTATQEGLIQKFFRAEQKSTSKPTESKPLPSTQTTQKKSASTPLPEEATISGEEPPQKKIWPAPAERLESYKTQRLPDSISKKNYTRDNEHLPKAAYNEEYKKILFDSAASGNLDVLRAMVDSFGNTEILNEEGDTPLIYATMAGNLESILTLVSMGANINAQNFYGITALYAATKLGRIDLVKLALSRSANPDLGDKNEKTPLMVSAEMDFSTILQLLLNSGAEIKKRMKTGDTALHLATKNSNLASMNLLITKGADIESRNFKGYTPLMLAVESDQEKAASLLLNAGADITKKNAQGDDVSTLAKNMGNNSIIDLIESEKTRQKLLAAKLIETRSTKITEDIEENDKAELPPSNTARRVGGIPLPFKRPENIIKPTKEALNRSKSPKPFFSSKELEQMPNN